MADKEKTQKVTAFNHAINTLVVGGQFWIGRSTTTRDVKASRVDEVKGHPHLEVKPEPEKKDKDKDKDKPDA